MKKALYLDLFLIALVVMFCFAVSRAQNIDHSKMPPKVTQLPGDGQLGDVVFLTVTNGGNAPGLYGCAAAQCTQTSNWTCMSCGGGGFTAGGDLSGSPTNQTVVKIQGRSVDGSAPSLADYFRFDGSQWTHTPLQAGDFPNFDASKITSGFLDQARIPATLNGDKVFTGNVSGNSFTSTGVGESFLFLTDNATCSASAVGQFKLESCNGVIGFTDSGGVQHAAETRDKKNVASGYAGLDGNAVIGVAQLGQGTANVATVLNGTRHWVGAAINVTDPNFGAKGDLQFVTNAVITNGSTTVTSATNPFAASDVGKTVLFDTSPGPQPTLVQVCSATNSTNGSCSSTCTGGTGAIDTTGGPRDFYYIVTVVNANGEGTHPSFEGWMRIPSGSNNNCVKISPPTTTGWTSPTSYKVYAALDQPEISLSNLTGSTPGLGSGTEQLQSTSAHCNNGNPTLATTCQLDTVNTATSAPPSPTWTKTTVASFVNSGTITIGATPAISLTTTLYWGTDNATPFTNALAAMTSGGRLFVPKGWYYVGSPGITFTNPFIFIEGEGAAGSKILGPAGANLECGGTTLAIGENGFPLMTWGTVNTQTFTGPKLANLCFQDITRGNATGAWLSYGMAHGIMRDVVFQDFWKGYAVTLNGGGTNNFTQFNVFDNVKGQAMHDGWIMTGGKSSEDYWTTIDFSGSQTGGGRGFRWDTNNSGNTTGGGAEKLLNVQMLYYPIMIQLLDRGTTSFIEVRGENSSSKQPGIAGGSDINNANFGTGMLLDDTPAKGYCTDAKIVAGSMNFFGLGYNITSQCSKVGTFFPGVFTSDQQIIDQSVNPQSLTGQNGLTTNTASFRSTVGMYNGITCTGQCIPAIYNFSNMSAVSAPIATTTLLTPTLAGMYRVCYNSHTTTAGSGTTGTVTIGWNDGIASHTDTGTWNMGATDNTGQVGKCVLFHSAVSQSITFATSGTVGTSVYAIELTAEQIR